MTLHQHIQRQQDIACKLSGVIEALCIIDNEKVAPAAPTALLSVAQTLADELNRNLDRVSLPSCGDA